LAFRQNKGDKRLQKTCCRHPLCLYTLTLPYVVPKAKPNIVPQQRSTARTLKRVQAIRASAQTTTARPCTENVCAFSQAHVFLGRCVECRDEMSSLPAVFCLNEGTAAASFNLCESCFMKVGSKLRQGTGVHGRR
jgi:hypothetical protein